MTQPTAPIAPVVKDVILDSLRNARDVIRPGVGDDLRQTLVWIDTMVVCDQHDSLLALRFADVIVGLEVGLGGLAEVHARPIRDAVARLRMASLLLFAARRERDLDARLREVLDLAGLIDSGKDAKHNEQVARAIARLARA